MTSVDLYNLEASKRKNLNTLGAPVRGVLAQGAINMVRMGSRLKLTKEYWAALRANPGTDREEVVRQAVASVGGELLFFGFTYGDSDALIIADTPTESDFLACLGKPLEDGVLESSDTFMIVSQDTIVGAFEKMGKVDYSPPGK